MFGIIIILFAFWLSWKLGISVYGALDSKIARLTGSLAGGLGNSLVKGVLKGSLSGATKTARGLKSLKDKGKKGLLSSRIGKNKKTEKEHKEDIKEHKEEERSLNKEELQETINSLKEEGEKNINNKIESKGEKKEFSKTKIKEKIIKNSEKIENKGGLKDSQLGTVNDTLNKIKLLLGKEYKENEKIILTDSQKKNKDIVEIVDKYNNKIEKKEIKVEEKGIEKEKHIETIKKEVIKTEEKEIKPNDIKSQKEEVVKKEEKTIILEKEKTEEKEEKNEDIKKERREDINKKQTIERNDAIHQNIKQKEVIKTENNINIGKVELKNIKEKENINFEDIISKTLKEVKINNPIHLQIINRIPEIKNNSSNINLDFIKKIESYYKSINKNQSPDTAIYMQTRKALKSIEHIKESKDFLGNDLKLNKLELSKLFSMKENELLKLINKKRINEK